MEIGRASPASSVIASAIESLVVSSAGMKAGAPIASCSDLAPIIRAFSNLVSLSGPTRISKPSSAARFDFLLSLEAAIVTKKDPEGRTALRGGGISLVFGEDGAAGLGLGRFQAMTTA